MCTIFLHGQMLNTGDEVQTAGGSWQTADATNAKSEYNAAQSNDAHHFTTSGVII